MRVHWVSFPAEKGTSKTLLTLSLTFPKVMRLFRRRSSDTLAADPQLTGLRFDQVCEIIIGIFSKNDLNYAI